ncbi:hypothetical protein DSCOOX_56030 [Desulfosarcina ovata subsp. ovata]|uniref:2Fe-2S ferredoxin-type domain-containing protein n=2 Tax=Desulfosarcina ovata TaxID=83564 RepID=A0A5K8AIB9_9BACT|nr:hypothetical protein DSCOOX_56030 [Desulfosarcina ovata subsp. ovata]
MIAGLLAGPSRPGQAFTMPGVNYDGLYKMARRIKACFDKDTGSAPVCLCTDDRAVMAATLLATLAGGPDLFIPHDLSPTPLDEMHAQAGFDRAICPTGDPLPEGVKPIDVTTLSDETESLAGRNDPDPDRTWVHLSGKNPSGETRLWSKTPRNLLAETAYLSDRYKIGSNDRILATIPALGGYGLLFSLLLPLTVSARVVAGHPNSTDTLGRQFADAQPTILVSVPEHYRDLKAAWPAEGALRLGFSAGEPLAKSDNADFLNATGVNLVEIYGSTATGGIAARCRADGESAFVPYNGIQWRVVGEQLDIRSPFLSAELPTRSSGWLTLDGQVKPNRGNGFMVAEPRRPETDSPLKESDRKAPQPIVTFEPSGLRLPLLANRTLHELAADNGIDIRADCGGSGVCGKCRVLVDPAENFSSLTPAELKMLTPEQLADGSRLACQARATGEGTVTIPDTLAESAETRGKTGISGSYPVDPMIRRLTVASPSPGVKSDNLPESLLDWISNKAGESLATTIDVAALRQLGRYRGNLKGFTLVLHEEAGMRRILEGEQTTSLGFAVDLGTTSVAGYLCNLVTGELLAADACVNPQRRFGEDVISRICRINEKDIYLDQFQRLAAEAINFLMQRCVKQIGVRIDEIDEIAICGNTTMQQVVAGLHPHGLGAFPYFPLILTPPVFSAGDLGLGSDPAVPVLLMPVVSGFVGGDTMAAILADRPHERDEVTLIVDIGTNGELALGNRDGLWVTSCATGPALEGAQISCGIRAVTGAIHRVWAEDTGRRINYEVLGEEGKNRPLGICGSGIIDAIASMRQIGVILPSGRLDETSDQVERDEKGVGRTYTLVPREQSATGSDISMTLKDIRQIQLAKGALSVGIEFLMRKAGIDRIDRTVLTGAFGAHFNWENALAIGMLPPAVAQSRVVAKDNLAGVGVVMALLDRKLRVEARDLCRRLRYLELATQSDFAMAFAQATMFPDNDT